MAFLLAHDSQDPQTARNRELARMAFSPGPIPKYGPAMLKPDYCGKWQVLETLLREWKKDSNKVLIFTKSVKLLEMLEFHLNTQGMLEQQQRDVRSCSLPCW